MRLGKLVALVIILALLYHYLDLIQASTKNLSGIYPSVVTYMEMFSYSSGLRTYVTDNNELPPDLPEWLDANFLPKAGKRCSEDYFGKKYRGGREIDTFYIRSCGFDRRCNTKDDLVLNI